jgi:hypothetical protein
LPKKRVEHFFRCGLFFSTRFRFILGWDDAIVYYTQAAEIEAEDDKLNSVIWANRAQVFLKKGNRKKEKRFFLGKESPLFLTQNTFCFFSFFFK